MQYNVEERQLVALETIAAELERLRLLREYELGVLVEYKDGDPHVVERGGPQARG